MSNDYSVITPHLTPMKIYVAGHNGMVGSAICGQLKKRDCQILTRTKEELDLLDQRGVRDFLQQEQADAVIVAAAKVGGIRANFNYPADFIYENLVIQTNLIHEAWCAGVNKLLFLGSSCIYPKLVEQPMREEALLTGDLESTNEPYAIAKIAGLTMCNSYSRQYSVDFRSVMPTNLYGPGDNFHPEHSHVLPALLQRFHEAANEKLEAVTIWGSGLPRREFLHVDDMAAGCLAVLDCDRHSYEEATGPRLNHLNLGTGSDITIAELAAMIAEITGFEGEIVYDTSKPDGTPRKLLDVSRINTLGWTAQIALREGIERTYQWYLENQEALRQR